MSRGNKIPFPRGRSAAQGTTIDTNDLQGVHLEGQIVYLPDAAKATPEVRRSNADVVARVVRNASGGALTPGTAVQYADGYWGTRVTTCTAAVGQQCAGIVDDHLPTAGVQANDLFYIVVRGPVSAAVGSGMTSHSGSVTKQGEPVWVSDQAGKIEPTPIAGTSADGPINHIIGKAIGGGTAATGESTSGFVTATTLLIQVEIE